MTDAARDQERRRLARMRQYRDALNAYDWDINSDQDGMHILAVRGGEAEPIATIHRSASPDESEVLLRALEHLRFSLDLLDRATAKIREISSVASTAASPPEQPEQRRRPENLGFVAKSLCGQPLFRRFLETRGPGSPVPDERAADTRLKFLLSIESKGEIDKRPEVKAAFLQLKNDYYLWKRGDP